MTGRDEDRGVTRHPYAHAVVGLDHGPHLAVEREGERWGPSGPLTVGSLRREIARVLSDHGLEQSEGSLVAPGSQGAVPHNTGNDASILRSGESLVVDLFPRRRLFADCTRTFCVGEPDADLVAAWSAVREALDVAYRHTSVGTRGWSVSEAVCRFL